MSSVWIRPDAPDVHEVERICRLPDPVVRNLQITHCYHRLSDAVSARTGACSNWCTFATWASKQAGATIRGEDLLDTLGRRLNRRTDLRHPVRSLWRALLRRGVFRPDTLIGRAVREIHTPFDAFERTSDAVARGNLEVFEEIGRAFARYVAECPPEAPVSGSAFARFLDGFSTGDPPDGQGCLRRAFTRYQQQRLEADPAERTELIVLANLEIGLHEQTRLQPEIRESLDAPLATARDLRARVLTVLLPGAGVWRSLLRQVSGGAIARAAAAIQQFSSALTREVITERLMVLSLPGGAVLALGRHIDAPMPDAFRQPRSGELAELLDRFEGHRPPTHGSGADDWSDLSQRMRFIIHLFCAFHERQDLRSPPFTARQVSELLSGRIPDGAL